MSKPITARALTRVLAKHPDRIIVLRTRDARGRETYLPLHATRLAAFDAKQHVVGLESLSPAAISLGYTEEDVPLRGKPAVVLSA